MGEDYFPDLFAIDELLAFADVSGDGEITEADKDIGIEGDFQY